jgi:hypothetical protein
MRTIPTKNLKLLTKNATAFVAMIGLIVAGGCTTTATQQQVLAEPMTSDLEAKVMKETGISGALLGALATGAATGALTFATLAASGASLEQAAVGAAIGGAAGAAAGGVAGYQMGKKEGQKVVAQAMTRDQVRQMVQGAREYNARLAKNNATLSSALQRAKASGDRKTLGTIRKEGTKELKILDQRLANREKALKEGRFPAGSDKSQYQGELAKAKSARAQLVKLVNESNNAVL